MLIRRSVCYLIFLFLFSCAGAQKQLSLAANTSSENGEATRRATARQLATRARAAYGRKDFAAFFDDSKAALDLEPKRWSSLFNYACAASLTGRLKEAGTALSKMLDGNIDLGIADAPDLARLRDSAEFDPLRSRLAKLDLVVARNESEIAFSLPEKDLLTEGIAFDPLTGDFFVSSVHHRKIVRRARGGQATEFVSEGRDGLWGVLGIAVDPNRRVLWACTAALPQMIGWDQSYEGLSGAFEYDLTTGKLLRRVPAPEGFGHHEFNDLAIDISGDVYFADSGDSAIYRLRARADKVETFIPAGIFRSPQGMAFSPDHRHLYVADYVGGLSTVDVATGKVDELTAPEDAFLLGIDGLVRFGDDLIVIQNLARPHRVARVRLDAAGSRVLKVEVMEMNDPNFREPTLGVVAENEFYYVAKSQWSLFDETTGNVETESLQNPLILKLKLE